MAASLEHSALRLRRRATALAVALLALIAVALGVGAWQLARAQSQDRADLRERYASRATVAAALVDSLFQQVFQQQGQQASTRFAGKLTDADVAAFARRNQNLFAAVVGPHDDVLAASPGAPSSLAGPLITSARRSGIAISGIQSQGGRKYVASAVRFKAAAGLRVLVTASDATAFRQFLTGTLKPLTPVEGGDAYVLDGHGAVLGAVTASRSRTPPPPSAELVGRVQRSRRGFYDLRGEQRYFAAAPQPNTAWHIVLSAPTSALYTPASGVSRWLPWVILGLLGVALVAIGVLARRAIEAGAHIAAANAELARSEERLRERAVELQRSNSELQRSNAELEQFAYVASHDLSAPLRAVAGFSQLLASRYRGRLDESAEEFIGHMQDGVERMQRIIDDLLAYSRVDRTELHPEDVDLEAILETVLRGLAPEIAERRAEVTHDSLPVVCGEPGQLAQLLQNLIANGMKFTAEGVEPRVHVSALRDGARWRVSVRDNGIGIDPDHVGRIFKMFQRLHSNDEYPGTGIGLAISEKIAERHGGEITVEPAVGGGSVFTFDVAVQGEGGP